MTYQHINFFDTIGIKMQKKMKVGEKKRKGTLYQLVSNYRNTLKLLEIDLFKKGKTNIQTKAL